MNEAEQRFSAYLDSHGYTWSHEPDYRAELGLDSALATTPDFLIARNGHRAIAEVRQFETSHISRRLQKSGGYAVLGPQEVYGPLRSAIWEKAQQLRPYAEAGLPLLIVLANPLLADVMLDEHHVVAAMWGNPGFVIPIDTASGGPVEGQAAHWKLEDYGAFASPVPGEQGRWINRHPHVTAVVIVHERPRSRDWIDAIMARHRTSDDSFEAATEAALAGMREVRAAAARGEEPAGEYQWVSVYEVGGEAGVPLPDGWFDGPRDERFGIEGAGYGRLL